MGMTRDDAIRYCLRQSQRSNRLGDKAMANFWRDWARLMRVVAITPTVACSASEAREDTTHVDDVTAFDAAPDAKEVFSATHEEFEKDASVDATHDVECVTPASASCECTGSNTVCGGGCKVAVTCLVAYKLDRPTCTVSSWNTKDLCRIVGDVMCCGGG